MSASGPHIVLVGAGHAHLAIARQAERFARAGLRLTLIDPGGFCYSGLATGVLGGQYLPELDRIDLSPWLTRAGAATLRARVLQVDTRSRTLRLDSGREIAWDVVSFNVGSRVPTEAIPGAGEHAWTVKPIPDLWRLRRHLEARFAGEAPPRRLIVIGGGPTGCEIACNLRELADRCSASPDILLLARSMRVLPRLSRGPSRSMAKALADREIVVRPEATVRAVQAGSVQLADGMELSFDELVLATGLEASRLMGKVGLPLSEDGSLRVRPTLQSIADPRVLAAGDCAHVEGHELRKIGVHAVRQSPILLDNLIRIACGEEPREYRPRRHALLILNLGRGRALAYYGAFWWTGRLSFLLKDRIDRRFLAKHRP